MTIFRSKFPEFIPTKLQAIFDKFPEDVDKYANGGEYGEDFYDEVYAYFVNNGDMPYGIAKARDGDPTEWIYEELGKYIPYTGD